MRNPLFITITCMVAFHIPVFAQEEDLLNLLGEDKPEREITRNAFKSTRVINSHSMEFLRGGTMDFRILHRFGQLDQGYKNFFGLDQASMRMGFDFGVLDNFMIGIGRSTYKKELDGYFKYAPVRQSKGAWHSPVTIALVAGMTMDGLEWAEPDQKNFFTSRLAYYYELIIGRKFSERFTLQLSPTLIHKNLVPLETDPNDIYALSIGGRFKLSKRIAFTWDYSHVVVGMPDSGYFHPLSLGLDIETGGHVFQLHFSNSTGMNERAFITETNGQWGQGQVRFGFNLSRVFQLSRRK